MIRISFSMENNRLLCSIEDNGVGRVKSNEYKLKGGVEYKSRGMYLTNERIKLLNTVFAGNGLIDIRVDDLESENHNCIGTLVVISFPLVYEALHITGDFKQGRE